MRRAAITAAAYPGACAPACAPGLGVVFAVVCASASPAMAQQNGLTGSPLSGGGGYTGGLLSNAGTDSRVGDLRPQLEGYFARNQQGPSLAAGPDWLISPSIGASIGATDNAGRITSPRRADVFLLVTPAVTVTRDAARLKLTASYAPTLSAYLNSGSQTAITQSGNIRALGIVVPDAVFVDGRASVSTSSLLGNGFSTQNNTSSFNRQNQVTTYAFSLTPYAEHRFAGWGTGRVGYSIARTIQDVGDSNAVLVNSNGVGTNAFNTTGFGTNGLSTNGLGTVGYGTAGNLTTQRERASFSTGENFGRFNDLSFLQATQYSGSGSYRGAHRNEAMTELGYALTRQITLLGGLGYQDLLFTGPSPVKVNEPTWNAGVRYNPNPDSTVTVLFGRRDGAASVSVDGQWSPTAQTRLVTRYSTGITSDIEEAQTLLDTTSIGPTGLVTDSTTGAPVTGGAVFGTQNGVYRVRRFSITGLLLRTRDSFSLGVVREARTTLTNTNSIFTNALIPAGTNSTSLYLSASWQHDLAPDMSTSLSAQYGITNATSQLLSGAAGNGSNQRTLSVSAALSKQFTPTLTGTVSYTFTNQSGGGTNQSAFNPVLGQTFNTGSYTENVVLVGLRKSF